MKIGNVIRPTAFEYGCGVCPFSQIRTIEWRMHLAVSEEPRERESGHQPFDP